MKANCLQCRFRWTLVLDLPQEGDSEQEYQEAMLRIQGIKCPSCRRNKRDTDYRSIEVETGENHAT